jgi:hypothetical protein
VLQAQQQNRAEVQREAARERAREGEERKRYEEQLGWAQAAERQEKLSSQARYQLELCCQVQEKKLRDSIDTELLGSGGQLRHNPITNPLEFHIDNPYLLRQMQQRRPR